MADFLHFGRKVPAVSVEKQINVAALQTTLARCIERPRWTAIFAKAFAITACEIPELRRAYLSFPTPHLYEYPSSVAAISIERVFDGESFVFPLLIKDPAAKSLADISRSIDHAKTAPLSDIKHFRRMLTFARLPRPLRRGLYSVGLNLGRQRANSFGTFALSSFGSFGAALLSTISPTTTFLYYGPIDGGCINLRGSFDHRVLDGARMARALVRIDEVVNGAIVEEVEKTPGSINGLSD
jgi:hypothetical protein